MYCPVIISSPAFSFETKRKESIEGAFVSLITFQLMKFVNIIRECMRTLVRKFWFVKSFSSQHHPKILATKKSREACQIRTKICQTRSFNCYVNLSFLRSRFFNCEAAFALIVFLLKERVLGLNNINIGRV